MRKIGLFDPKPLKELAGALKTGSLEKKRNYERTRNIHPQNAPEWLRPTMDTLARKHLFVNRRDYTPSNLRGKYIVKGSSGQIHLSEISPAQFTQAMSDIFGSIQEAQQFPAEGRKALEQMMQGWPAPRSDQEAIDRHLDKRFNMGLQSFAQDAGPVLAKGAMLEDLEKLYDLPLSDFERRKIVNESRSHWDLTRHPLLTQRAKLLSHFEEQVANSIYHRAQRADLHEAFRQGRGPQTLQALNAWLSGERLQPQKPGGQTPHESEPTQPNLTPDRETEQTKTWLKKSLAHKSLSSETRGRLSRKILTLMGQGRLSQAQLETWLTTLSESELLSQIDGEFDRHTEPDKEVKAPTPLAPEEAANPKKEQLTNEQLLTRLDQAHQIDHADLIELKKRLYAGNVHPEFHEAVMEHVLLAGMALGGRDAGTHKVRRILLATVPQRHGSGKFEGLAGEVTARLVREGKIIKRNGSGTPTPSDNVKINPTLRHKYVRRR